MIISPRTPSHRPRQGRGSTRRHEPLYRIEHGDGTAETASELPPAFVAGATSSVSRFRRDYSTRFYEIRTALGMDFTSLEDFARLAEQPALLTSVELPITDWSIVVLNFLKRLGLVLEEFDTQTRRATLENMRLSEQAGRRAYAQAWREIASSMRLISGWITSTCNRLLSSHWSQAYARLPERFDRDGVVQHQGRLPSLKARVGFLHDILYEMERPIGCQLIYDAARAAEGMMPWRIVLQWRYALQEEDIEHMKGAVRELDRQLYDEMYPTPPKPVGTKPVGAGSSSRRRIRQLRPTKAQLAIAQRHAPPGYAPSTLEVPATTTSGQENEENAGSKIRWRHRLTDLVFIMDACKEAGLIDATDAEIIALVDYASQAQDKAKTYRDTRSKIKLGKQHPDRAMLERLIAILQQGLR